MIKIRCGVFETNSSSVHSLVIAQNEEIKKLENNELLVNLGYKSSGDFISYKNAILELVQAINCEEDRERFMTGEEEVIYDLMREYEVAERFEDYLNQEYLESYSEDFVTEKGDHILIFGRYGRDC